MARHKRGMEEAFGPALDGREDVAELARSLLDPLANIPEPEKDEPQVPPESRPVLLICGGRHVANEVAALAVECGFSLELARNEEPMDTDETVPLAQQVHVVPNYDDLVNVCAIGREHYVCVFVQNAAVCEHILQQCLASEAAYVGAWAELDLRNEIFARLKAAGAPDAELAAICCPIGLAIGAVTAPQQGVAIMAEVLAAKSGVLKRLRLVD